MEGDLISRSALEKDAYDDYHYRGKLEDWELNLLQDYLAAAPAVDAVEVVRCKDCIHREDMPAKWSFCKFKMDGTVMDRDFCSYGKRKVHE